MKSLPIFISKSDAMQRIAKRNASRIKDYTRISQTLSDTQKSILKECLDPIARYAERNHALLEFVPASDLFEGSIEMNVHKKGLTFILDEENLPIMALNMISLSGSSILPNGKRGADLARTVKNDAKNIISNDSDWCNKFMEYKCNSL